MLKLRKDGTIGSLFINAKARLPIGKWMKAEPYRKKGYAYRPGWHVMTTMNAPHLKEEGRVWANVEVRGVKEMHRPESQGGTWLICNEMKITKVHGKENQTIEACA